MPSLSNLKCTLEIGSKNIVLREYGTIYGDGSVETYIAVPAFPTPFSIHLVSQGYIAPGLAMFVSIDGVRQCNRNRRGLKEPDEHGHHTNVDFRVRQSERKLDEEKWIGRQWSFAPINAVDDAPSARRDVLRAMGTIDVIVLRCGQSQRENSTGNNDKPAWIQELMATGTDDRAECSDAADIASRSRAFAVDGAYDDDRILRPILSQRHALPHSIGLDGHYDRGERDPRRYPISDAEPGPAFPPWYNSADYYARQRPEHGAYPTPQRRFEDPRFEQPRYEQPRYDQAPSQDPQTDPRFNYDPRYHYPPRGTYDPYPYQYCPPPADYRYPPPPGWSHAVPAAAVDTTPVPAAPLPAAPAPSPQAGTAPGISLNALTAALNQVAQASQTVATAAQDAKKDEDKQAKAASQTGQEVSWGDAPDNNGWDNNAQQASDNKEASNEWSAGNRQPAENAAADSWSNNDENKQEDGGTWGNNDNKKQEDTGTWGDPGNQNQTDTWGEKPAESANKTKKAASGDKGKHRKQNDKAADKPDRSRHRKREDEQAKPAPKGNSANSGLRNPFVVAEEPLKPFPKKYVEKKNIDYQVQMGEGALYWHQTSRPKYLDTMEKPYARFVFKYRSKDVLESLLDVKVREEKEDYRNRAKALSKDDLVEELIKAKKALGYNTDSDVEFESDAGSSASSNAGSKAASTKTAAPKKNDSWGGGSKDADKAKKEKGQSKTKDDDKTKPDKDKGGKKDEWCAEEPKKDDGGWGTEAAAPAPEGNW